MARPRTPRPSHVRVRMYQVGFGDCFLVSFHYRRTLADGRAERHILFDFGSTRAPGRRRLLPGVAQLLEQHTNGRLDVLVATHRHKDHIDGFGLPVTAAVIDRLEPGLVVRPWTDHPKLPDDARAPAAAPARIGSLRRSRRDRSSPVSSPRCRVRPAAGAARRARGARLRPAAEPHCDREPRALGEERRGVYLAAGGSSRNRGARPRDHRARPRAADRRAGAELTRQRATDPEYWLAQLAQLEGSRPAGRRRGRRPALAPGPVAWLVERLERQQLASLLRIVRTSTTRSTTPA